MFSDDVHPSDNMKKQIFTLFSFIPLLYPPPHFCLAFFRKKSVFLYNFTSLSGEFVTFFCVYLQIVYKTEKIGYNKTKMV